MTGSGLRRRLERLEKGQAPGFYTLEDLVLASYGHPLPPGKVYGGPLRRAFEEIEARAEARREARDGTAR